VGRCHSSPIKRLSPSESSLALRSLPLVVLTYDIAAYTIFWSYHSPSRGVYDFETSGKNVQRMLDYAREAGLYVIARVVPYCNAETNEGDYTLWGSDGSLGLLRTSDETYYQAWLPWISQNRPNIGSQSGYKRRRTFTIDSLEHLMPTSYQLVILIQVENELQETAHLPNNTLVLYIEQLESAFRAVGIIVPLYPQRKGLTKSVMVNKLRERGRSRKHVQP
jgi:hypothetical protein